jgi:hypothetical protein
VGAFSISTTVQGTDADIMGGDYFLISDEDTDFYVWFTVDGFR